MVPLPTQSFRPQHILHAVIDEQAFIRLQGMARGQKLVDRWIRFKDFLIT